MPPVSESTSRASLTLAVDVVVLDEHVAQIDADPKLDLGLLGS
jgi:hypothetical protein